MDKDHFAAYGGTHTLMTTLKNSQTELIFDSLNALAERAGVDSEQLSGAT
jgi:hypothetical protein